MKKRTRAALALGLTGALCVPANALADEYNQTRGLRKAVTPAGITEHLAAFQTHSTLGGNRVAGSPGFEASADYVTQRLRAAGYDVRDDPFEFQYNADRTPPELAEVGGKVYVDGVDFGSMTYSPSGTTTADVVAVDAASTTSGCEAADFAGFPAGAVALVKRGGCTFAAKGSNAAAADASGVIVFNNVPGVLNGTLGGPQSHAAPVVGTTPEVGADLANDISNGRTGSQVRIEVDRVAEQRTTRNVVTELRPPGATADGPVVVVGAHLDSVPRGAGINDNGSGSATVLEIAEALASREFEPKTTIRFTWYSAEEFGLLGSRAYVAEQSKAELARVKAMLNFDMVGSLNFVRFVYDGDNSAFPASGTSVADGPDGSGEIEAIFTRYFSHEGLASAPTPFNGRSDYGPFIAQGIPAGGLFTGAEGTKTAEEAATFGGTAGVAYDRCYHLRCDDLSNVSSVAIDQMSDAAAHATLTLAKRDYAKAPLVDPPSTVGGSGSGGGGGLHAPHDHEESER